MRLRGKTFLIALTTALLLLSSCSRPQGPQASCDFVQSPEMQRVSWKGRFPIRIYLHKSVPVGAYEAIDLAVSQYNATIGDGRELIRIEARGVDGELNPVKDGYSTIYWYKTWDTNRPTEQARTTIYWSGVEIFEADMRINEANFKYTFSSTGANASSISQSTVDLYSLVLHEFGHVFGLAHTTAQGSAMNAVLSEGQVRRKLGTTDINNLKCEY